MIPSATSYVENHALILENLFAETFKSFRRNIFKEAKVDTDLYNILYELQNGLGKSSIL